MILEAGIEDGNFALMRSMSLSIPFSLLHPGEVSVAAKTTYAPALTEVQVAYKVRFEDGVEYDWPGVYEVPVPDEFEFHVPEN